MWRVAEAVGGGGSCECDARGLNEGSVVLQPFYCRQDRGSQLGRRREQLDSLLIMRGRSAPPAGRRGPSSWPGERGSGYGRSSGSSVRGRHRSGHGAGRPVAGGGRESGNAGAPALAVTMRRLVLREISLRHWPHMVWKEASVGLINGVAVALTTALAVRVWSPVCGTGGGDRERHGDLDGDGRDHRSPRTDRPSSIRSRPGAVLLDRPDDGDRRHWPLLIPRDRHGAGRTPPLSVRPTLGLLRTRVVSASISEPLALFQLWFLSWDVQHRRKT
jgi:hypothetical protein